MLRLFDTAEGRVVPIEFRDPGKVSMYVCGPTVYGPAHLGHGRFSLVFDILRRYLEWSGYEVTYVSNITDIDDNIINKANEEGRTTDEVVDEYERLWYEAMDAIGVKRPTIDPHATAFVGRMVELVTDLVASGYAYETDDGVYFTPERIDDYGLLNHQSADSLRAGARVQVDDQKKSPIDFALWKKAKPDEPQWPSPWGPGRPGWHTECVVMALDLLGDGFDIHGGAIDLIFPHHENERAQAVATGHGFARHWVHNGFLEVGGQKMSKSLGNFTTLMDLVESTDARAYRLLVLRSHYRSPMEVDRENTADATKALETLDTFARRSAEWFDAEVDDAAIDEFRAAMDDDLDTPKAIAQLFTLVRRANHAADDGDIDAAAPLAAAVREICGAVGLELRAAVGDVPEEVVELARQRDDARAATEWALADRLRDEIQAAGFLVEDTPDGAVVRRS